MKIYKQSPCLKGKERFCIECNIKELRVLSMATSFVQHIEYIGSLPKYIHSKLIDAVASTFDNNSLEVYSNGKRN